MFAVLVQQEEVKTRSPRCLRRRRLYFEHVVSSAFVRVKSSAAQRTERTVLVSALDGRSDPRAVPFLRRQGVACRRQRGVSSRT